MREIKMEKRGMRKIHWNNKMNWPIRSLDATYRDMAEVRASSVAQRGRVKRYFWRTLALMNYFCTGIHLSWQSSDMFEIMLQTHFWIIEIQHQRLRQFQCQTPKVQITQQNSLVMTSWRKRPLLQSVSMTNKKRCVPMNGLRFIHNSFHVNSPENCTTMQQWTFLIHSQTECKKEKT